VHDFFFTVIRLCWPRHNLLMLVPLLYQEERKVKIIYSKFINILNLCRGNVSNISIQLTICTMYILHQDILSSTYIKYLTVLTCIFNWMGKKCKAISIYHWKMKQNNEWNRVSSEKIFFLDFLQHVCLEWQKGRKMHIKSIKNWTNSVEFRRQY